MLPLITVFVLLVLLMLMGTMAATGAFIAQRDLMSVCDETATGVASEVEAKDVLTNGVQPGEPLPLSPEAVAAAVEAWRVRFHSNEPELQMTGKSDGKTATVQCRTKVKVPFGTVFGLGGGLDRDAVSVVRSPVRESTPTASIVPNDPSGNYAGK